KRMTIVRKMHSDTATDSTPVYVGVDIGGTSTRLGLFQTLESPEFLLIARFLTLQSYEQQIQSIIDALQSCGVSNFASIGVSIDVGHQILDGNTRVCLCGQVGCLETFTGGRQLELRLGHSVAQVTDTAFWETFSDKLALGLVNLAQLTKVEAVAVSGAIALNNPFLLPLLEEKVNAIIRGAILELKLAALGENAPIVGAALLLEVPEETIVH